MLESIVGYACVRQSRLVELIAAAGRADVVHQLAELRMVRDGLNARPNLVTQMGNQRACNTGRMQSVEILRRNQLGRPVEAWVWTGGVERGHYFADAWSAYGAAKPVPEWLDWDLWRGPLTADLPYSEDFAPRRWRAFWETGGGQLADWGCHLLDLLFFAYDLPSPEAVLTHTIRPAGTPRSLWVIRVSAASLEPPQLDRRLFQDVCITCQRVFGHSAGSWSQ